MAKTNGAGGNGSGDDTGKPPEGDGAPLLDLNEASVKKLLIRAKKRGYITYDELNEALPQDQMSSEQIEDVMAALSEMGINVIENDEPAEEGAEPAAAAADEEEEEAEADPAVAAAPVAKAAPLDRTDDPVRMYLREMGAVELLSREGEIAIAKRIEAGRNTMIAGLCESPMTFHAMIDWSTALNEGRMQLREILDLDAMLSKGPSEAEVANAEAPTAGSDLPAAAGYKDDEAPEHKAAPEEPEDEVHQFTERRLRPDGQPAIPDDDDEDNTLSLAQMEEQLKPEALEKFAEITATYKKFQKLQAGRLDALGSGSFAAADERKYQKLREELTRGVQSIHFNNGKIEYLVDQLYSYNRRLLTLGTAMMKLADKQQDQPEGVPRRICRARARRRLDGSRRRHRQALRRVRGGRDRQRRPHPRRGERDRAGDRRRPGRVPPDHKHGPEGRARGAHRQEGDGRGEPAPGNLDRQEIYQPRIAVPRSYPGGQHRLDEGGRQVRVPPRL